MGCRKLNHLATLTAAILLIFGANVLAVESTCIFNEDTQEIEVTISNGESVDYVVHYILDTDITNCLTPAEDSIIVAGPNGNASVVLNCDFVGGGAHIEVQVCKAGLCFDFYNLYFVCDHDCHIRQVRDRVPTITTWGIIVLTLILMSVGVYILRRKKVSVK